MEFLVQNIYSAPQWSGVYYLETVGIQNDSLNLKCMFDFIDIIIEMCNNCEFCHNKTATLIVWFPTLQYHAIFGALEAILLRILDDLTKHAPVGKAILQKILSVGMPSVYFMLGPQIKAAAVKTTLRMLGALVMLGEGGAKALLLQLDTTHQHVQSLFTRRNAKVSKLMNRI